MDMHKNAGLTPKRREQMVRAVVDGWRVEQGRCSAAVQHYAKNGRQMGRALPRRRYRWIA
jgi:hypothetical protein